MPSWLLYLIESAGWALLGFLGGYLAGRAARDVHTIAQTVKESTVDGRTTEPPARAREWWPPSGQFVLGCVVVLLGVLTVTQGLIANAETARLTACQAAYANGFADAIDARQASQNAAQSALDQLMTTVGSALQGNQNSRVATQHAIANYLAKRHQFVAQQRAHPYPEPPRDACQQ